jgi:putative ABC transport system permease protein
VRASADPRSLAGAIREALRELDPNVPLSRVLTMDDLLGDALAPSWFRSVLLTAFAGFALVLAALGIYGVMSYTVSRQLGEIGLRMALGARPAQVLGLVAGRALRLTLTGVFSGSLAALWLTRYLKGLLFGVAATDGVTFLSAAAILLLVAMAASYLPAWRAARVDPVEALRRE